MIIDNLAGLPSTITTGDELPVERGTTVYKIDYNALAAAILSRLGAGSDNIVDVANGGTGANNLIAARDNLHAMTANGEQTYTAFSDVSSAPGAYLVANVASGIADAPYSNSQGWWNCLVLGVANRQTQIATEAYAGYSGRDELWLRSKHDTTWGEWKCINSSIDTWATRSTNVVNSWNASFLASGNATVAYDYRGTLRITVQGVTTKTGTDWLFQLRSAYRENFSSTKDAYFTCYLGDTPTTCYLTHNGYLYVKNLNTTDLMSIDIAVAMV